jgi:omega-hydroxy-beta-dihydromenaquinone-9 sulfotransferase
MSRLIFVVGNSRSGTTMLGRALDGHGSVFAFNELHYFEQMWNPGNDPKPIGYKASVARVARLLTIQHDGYYSQKKPDEYAQEASAIVDQIPTPVTPPDLFDAFIDNELSRQGKSIGCDQTPRNLYYLDELLHLYRDARVVVIVRDPRDVLLSQKNRWKRRRLGAGNTPRWNALRTWAGYHPITISMLWRSGIAAGDRVIDHARVATVRFEDLASDPEAALRKVCDRIGLDFDPAMLDVPRVGSSHEHDKPDEKGIDSTAAGRWKHGGLTRTEIAVCQRIAGESMQKHGYELEPIKASALAFVWYRVTWVCKGALALILNLHRSRNLFEALRRRLGR